MPVSVERELYDTVKGLLKEQRVGVLATGDMGGPHASLVAYAETEKLEEIVFATTRASRKYSLIGSGGDVVLLVDNRTNRVSDFHSAVAVTARGRVNEPEGADRKKSLAVYLAKNPHLEEFVESPSCALLVISVREFDVVRRFQEVHTLQVRK